MDKQSRLVAVIYPQAGGYMARILPPGIVCFSESLEGLHQEIEIALEKYSADVRDMADEEEGVPVSEVQADWEEMEDNATVFVWDLEEKFPH